MLDDQLKRIEEMVMKLTEMADETNQKLARIERRLDSTFEQAALSAEIGTDIKAGVSEIAATQDRHERILEVLSLRSIEHESIIKHI